MWDRVFDPVAARSAAGILARMRNLLLKETAALRAAAGSKTRPHTEKEAQSRDDLEFSGIS